MRETTQRDELKKALRENTKDAFRAIKTRAAGTGFEFTAKELAEMTNGRLSTRSIAGFFANNHGDSIVDSLSGGNRWSNDIEVRRDKRKKLTTKTYVNIEDNNDYITVRKVKTFYTIKEIYIN